MLTKPKRNASKGRRTQPPRKRFRCSLEIPTYEALSLSLSSKQMITTQTLRRIKVKRSRKKKSMTKTGKQPKSFARRRKSQPMLKSHHMTEFLRISCGKKPWDAREDETDDIAKLLPRRSGLIDAVKKGKLTIQGEKEEKSSSAEKEKEEEETSTGGGSAGMEGRREEKDISFDASLARAVGDPEGFVDEFPGLAASDLDPDAGALVHLHVRLLRFLQKSDLGFDGLHQVVQLNRHFC